MLTLGSSNISTDEFSAFETNEHVAVAGCVVDLLTGLRLPDNTAGDAEEQARWFLEVFTTNSSHTAWTSINCIWQIGLVRLGVGEVLKDLINEAFLKGLPKLAAKVSNPAGWAALVLEGVNTTVPVFSSYLLPTAGDVDYALEWAETPDGTPYIVRVSKQAVTVTPLPTITSVSDGSATEGDTLRFTVQLSGSTTQTETYYYSTYSGGRAPADQGDYTKADEQAVQVPSGSSSFTIQVRTNQDADSDDETFYLYVTGSLPHPTSTPGSSRYRGTGTIHDDDSSTTSALPDLIISSASLDDTTVEQGDRIRLDVTVRNQGEGEADRSRVGYYISSGSTLTLLDDDSVSSLDANESDDEYDNISTSNLTPGAHCIVVRADYEEEIVESDETNNLYYPSDLCFAVTAP